MQTINYPPVQQALDRLKALSADAQTRQQALVRERAIIEEAMAMSGAREEGIEIGKAEGKAEGAAAVLTRLLSKRFGPLSPDAAQRLQTATVEQLELWTDRVLDAPTLAAVFDAH